MSSSEQVNIPCAWVTLATNDTYAIGALVLAHSIRAVGTRHRLHVLYTSNVSQNMREQLRNVFDDLSEVNLLESGDAENLDLIGRPELGVTFTKLHCWQLTQYSKCVFLDADTFVLQNADELFDRPEFSAAPDIGWPDYFNSGVFVFVPSNETYKNLLEFSRTTRAFDGGDQGLLNEYFSGWRESDASHRLPFIYNVTTEAIYGYAAAIKKHAPHIKIVHFIGKQKPWLHYGSEGAGTTYVTEFVRRWNDMFQRVKEDLPTHLQCSGPSPSTASSYHSCQHNNKRSVSSTTASLPPYYLPDLHDMLLTDDDSYPIIVGTPTQTLQFGAPTNSGQLFKSRYEAWEAGIIDYKGADAFDNIQKVIDRTLAE